jgi:peptidoglycan/xylan/chitin deacetylase (PgdA/CDA1 family)
MNASERQGLRDAFYFIADHSAGEVDGSYSLDEPWIRRLMREIHERGHEIGLHPSFNTFSDEEQTRREFERLLSACDEEGIAQDVWGARQHYLRWENPTTWRNYESAGLTYDTSLTFAERPGFRCGVCFEYAVFDLLTRRPLRLRERPLIIMDGSLLGYQQLSLAQAAEEIARLRERCHLYKGDFTLLWHNSMLLDRGVRRLYERAIEER